MKSLCIAVSFILATCAPHTDWYKPIGSYHKSTYLPENGVSTVKYTGIHKDSLEFSYNVAVASLPRSKNISYDLTILNRKTRFVTVDGEDIRITSNRLHLDNPCSRDSIFVINSGDSLRISCNEFFAMSDSEWYGEMKQNDTLTLHFTVEDEQYSIPFYFNKKDRLETYPF